MAKSEKKSWAFNIVLLVVIAAWAGAIGYFVARGRGPDMVKAPGPLPSAGDTAADDRVASWDEERWMGIYQGRNKIGYMFTRLRNEDQGYLLWSKTRFKITLMDISQEMRMDLQARLQKDYSVDEFTFESVSDMMNIEARGRRDGQNLVIEVDTGGETVSHTLRFNSPPTLEYQWLVERELKKAEVGREFTFVTFNPLSQTEDPVTVRVAGEEEVEISGAPADCWKVEVKVKEDTRWWWVRKSDAKVVKWKHLSMGLTTILEGKQEAMNVDWEKAGETDLLVTFMVPSNTALPNPRSMSHMKALLHSDQPGGLDLSGLDIELPGRQTLSGYTVEVSIETALPAEGYKLPISESLPEKAEEFAAYLEPTAYVQSDNEKIVEAAEKARDGAEDAVTATDNLLAWVSENVNDSLVVTIPSALDVLERKRGACKEHTVLFVALARASGIPTRTVSGIVYSEQMINEGFYYHAWAEVYLADSKGNGRWVAVDPTFNQNPADATHIRMVLGELGEMMVLNRFMGSLKVTVEDYR